MQTKRLLPLLAAFQNSLASTVVELDVVMCRSVPRPVLLHDLPRRGVPPFAALIPSSDGPAAPTPMLCSMLYALCHCQAVSTHLSKAYSTPATSAPSKLNPLGSTPAACARAWSWSTSNTVSFSPPVLRTKGREP